MANISVDINKSRNNLLDEDKLAQMLNGLYSDVESVRVSLRYKITAQEMIAQRLRSVAEQIKHEQDAVKALRSGLEMTAGRYMEAEEANLSRIVADIVDFEEAGSSMGPKESWLPVLMDYLWELFENIVISKAFVIPLVRAIINPVVSSLLLNSGLAVGSSSYSSASGDWFGYELTDDHPGITAWVGKASAEAGNDWSSAEVNAYVGKAEAEAKADGSFMEYKKKKKYMNGEWTETETLDVLSAEIGASASVSALAGDAKAEVGGDMLGAEVKAEGNVGEAVAEAKGEFSIGEDGVNAVASGKAMVAAAEGKASGTINILGIEITGKVGGYAGAAGVEGKIGFEDNKFVLEGGLAAVFGVSGGVEIGFNEEGWSNFIDFITFWD